MTKTELIDLNYDCHFLILNQLELNDLVNLAAVNKKYSILAGDFFQRLYAHNQLIIRKPMMESLLNTVRNAGEVTFIYGHELAMSLLEHFGSYILSLKIDTHIDAMDDTKRLVSLASEYCVNLINFHISSDSEDALEGVNKPFYKVEDLTFGYGSLNRIGNEKFNVNEMFPKIRRLFLDSINLTDTESIDVFIPNMVRLDIKFMFKSPKYEEIKDLISKNPQIREVRIPSIVNSSLISFLSKKLPKLEKLEAEVIVNDYQWPIYFKNVKYFNGNGANNYTFNKLEVFECRPDYSDLWIEIIKKHQNIHTLILNNLVFSNLKLPLVARNTDKLKKTIIHCDNDLEPKTIVNFLKENNSLNKLEFCVRKAKKDKFYEIESQVEDEWNFAEENNSDDFMTHFSLERKY